MASRLSEISIDCGDARALAAFWCAVLDHRVDEDDEPGLVSIAPRDGSGPLIVFAQVPEPKTVKNRVHLDVSPTDRDQDAEVARLESLGARRADVGQGEQPWVVMTDPEGNEFCVLGGPGAEVPGH